MRFYKLEKTIVRKGNDKSIMLISNFKGQYVFIFIHILIHIFHLVIYWGISFKSSSSKSAISTTIHLSNS